MSRTGGPEIHVTGYAHVETELDVPVSDLTDHDIRAVITEAQRRGLEPGIERDYAEMAYRELMASRPNAALALLDRALYGKKAA